MISRIQRESDQIWLSVQIHTIHRAVRPHQHEVKLSTWKPHNDVKSLSRDGNVEVFDMEAVG